MSSGWRDKSGWGEEEVAVMTTRGQWVADNATRSDGRAADNGTRGGSNDDG